MSYSFKLSVFADGETHHSCVRSAPLKDSYPSAFGGGFMIRPLNREECSAELKLIDTLRETVVVEIKANNQIIKDKVKGQIRKAQSANKILKQKLLSCEYAKSCYNNGGIC
jgi:hypothetical protein